MNISVYLIDTPHKYTFGNIKNLKRKIMFEGTPQNIRNGKSIALDSVTSLCNALNCQPRDILDYIPDTLEAFG